MKLNTKSKQGFTIIEVVLVLAIAGLIFLMVFIAFPALQRSQHDTQRRQDYTDLSSAIQQYKTSNSGKLPAAGVTLAADKYINKDGEDPSGLPYRIIVENLANNSTQPSVPAITDTETTVYIYTNATCGQTSVAAAEPSDAEAKAYDYPVYTTKSRSFVVYGRLEAGFFCLDGE